MRTKLLRLTLRLRVGTLCCAVVLAGLSGCATVSKVPGCDVNVRIEPNYDARPRHLDVQLSFPAAGRSQSELKIDDGWAGIDFSPLLVNWSGASRGVVVQTGQDRGTLLVNHPANGMVVVTYQALASLEDPDSKAAQDLNEAYRTQIGSNWFQFFGHSVFPLIRTKSDRPPTTCAIISDGSRKSADVFGSHFGRSGEEGLAQIVGEENLLHAFYAGGDGWRTSHRVLSRGEISFALRGHFGFNDHELIDRASLIVDTQRRFWNADNNESQWLVVTPNNSQNLNAGTVVTRAAALHVGESFKPSSTGFEFLVAHENLHHWIPNRFGRSDFSSGGAYWFSEGFSEYYTHRLLLESGIWSADQYADAMTSRFQRYWRSPLRNAAMASLAPLFFSDIAASDQFYFRGEILAHRWAQQLHAAGANLDELMRALLLEKGSDPESAPLATERLLDAVGRYLGDSPRRDVASFVIEGQDLPLEPQLLGQCFEVQWQTVPRRVVGLASRSFEEKVAIDVDPQGPAFNAGLRDGMKIERWSPNGTRTDREVELFVRDGVVLRTIRFFPVDGSVETLPVVSPVGNRPAFCSGSPLNQTPPPAAPPRPHPGG